MFEFESPYWLWIGGGTVLLLAVLFYRASSGRKGALQKFLAPHLVEALTASVSPQRRRVKMVLLMLGISLMFVALARPRVAGVLKDRVRRGLDIIVAVDTSKSMMAEDVRPNRLTRAKLAVNELLNTIGGDRVGLIAFAGASFLQCPLTLDFDNFRESLNVLDTSIIPRGGTDLGGAIREATAAFDSLPTTSNFRILIIVTDGEDLEGHALEDARAAAAKNMRIFTVGVGTAAGEIIPQVDDLGQLTLVKDPETGKVVRSRLDEATLQKIAEASNGGYMPLGAAGDGLQRIYHKYLEPLPKQELSKRKERVYEEWFQIPLLLGLACFVVEYMLSTRRIGSRLEPEPPAQRGRHRPGGAAGRRNTGQGSGGTAPTGSASASPRPQEAVAARAEDARLGAHAAASAVAMQHAGPPSGRQAPDPKGRLRPATMAGTGNGLTSAWMLPLLLGAMMLAFAVAAQPVAAQQDSSGAGAAPPERLQPVTPGKDGKIPAGGSKVPAGSGSPQKAEELYKKGDFRNAMEQYKASLESAPSPELAFNIGASAYKAGDYETASMGFDGALMTKDLNLQQRAYYNMGNVLYRMGEPLEMAAPQKAIEAWENAVKKYDASLKLNPKDGDARYNRDFVQQKIDRLKQQQQQQKNDQKQDKQDKDEKKDKQDEKKDEKGGDGGQGADQDQGGEGQGDKKNQQGGGQGEGKDKKQDGQSGQDKDKKQQGKNGNEEKSDKKDDSGGNQNEQQEGKGNEPKEKGQGKSGQQNNQDDKNGKDANEGQSGQDKKQARPDQNQPGGGDTTADAGEPKEEPGEGKDNGKAAKAKPDDRQPEPGSMSKAEAQALLDSLKDEEQRFPLGDNAPQTDERIKDW
ncbi:hypothetical protein DB346_13975 [Verrucomicrobia bacterium LW23]|nr:hypothetical protein DB346_13975 [Verrucomicrobia bacterium LW23]